MARVDCNLVVVDFVDGRLTFRGSYEVVAGTVTVDDEGVIRNVGNIIWFTIAEGTMGQVTQEWSEAEMLPPGSYLIHRHGIFRQLQIFE